MSERGYFSQRNLIPGSTFLIILLACNYSIILDWLRLDYSALLGVAGVLIGSPTIGFLISQIWYWHFQSKIKLYDWKPVSKLKKAYSLSEKLGKREVLIIYDYVLHKGVHSGGHLKGLSSYLFRRYDNYVLLSTTRLSLILGIFFGIMFRVMREIYPLGLKSEDVGNLLVNFLWGSELFVWILLIVAVSILIFAISKGLDWIKFDYDEMHTAIVLDSAQARENYKGVTREDLKKAFPSYFLDDEKPTEISGEEKTREK